MEIELPRCKCWWPGSNPVLSTEVSVPGAPTFQVVSHIFIPVAAECLINAFETNHDVFDLHIK